MTDQPDKVSEIDAPEGTVQSLAARYGRRALMLGAAATGAGLAVSLVGGGAADAAPDSSPPVLLGKSNKTSGSTVVTSTAGTGLSGHTTAKGQSGLSGYDDSTAGATGIYGKSLHGTGILGSSTNANGVVGQARTPGFSGVAGLDFATTKGGNGVYGQTYNGFGVFGIGIGGGNGVGGHSNTSGQNAIAGVDSAPSGGTAIFGQSAKGLALHAEGKVKFSNSGVVTVPAGQDQATVAVTDMTPSSLVFATIQQPQTGVYVAGAQAGTGSFTLTLSVKTSAKLRVAWFVLD